jgi:N-acetylmuramoyl-L-alanine amidase
MSFSIDNHLLFADGEPVRQIPSPYVSGGFAEGHPRILVMHFTYGGSAESTADWFRSPDNNGSSAHLVLDRDGTPIQCVRFDTVAWHAGASALGALVGLNRYALGIELANWGYLRRSGGGWSSYTGKPIASPVLAVHKNGNPDGSVTPIGWEPYPDAQFDAAVAIAARLAKTYGITRIVGHDDIAPDRKWDPGPAFDMMRFRQLVLGEAASEPARVVSPTGLNLRKGPGLDYDVITLLADGTGVAVHERSGVWVQVSVLDAGGVAQRTGWVNGHYLSA